CTGGKRPASELNRNETDIARLGGIHTIEEPIFQQRYGTLIMDRPAAYGHNMEDEPGGEGFVNRIRGVRVKEDLLKIIVRPRQVSIIPEIQDRIDARIQ